MGPAASSPGGPSQSAAGAGGDQTKAPARANWRTGTVHGVAAPAGPGQAPPGTRPMPARPSAQAPAGARAAANTGAKSPADFSSNDIDRVYNQYVAARGKNAERTDNVKRETIEKTIRTMLPQLEQKHAGKKIDFEVVVKDGRVALKPVAK